MNIFVVPIECLDSRYTKQWYTYIPQLLMQEVEKKGLSINVITIDGRQIADGTTPGAFLDFAVTNAYKASQVEAIAIKFHNGFVKPGDKFLITDAWNPVITSIKYMSELLNIPVEIHGIWEAGAHDPTDILGYKMEKNWVLNQERAWFYACDFNYVASEFHRKIFLKNLNIPAGHHSRLEVTPHPSGYLVEDTKEAYKLEPLDQVVFTHRLNADKQPEIFRDMIRYLNEREVVGLLTKDFSLNKDSYYQLLGKSKVAFSCSLHENFGYGQMESTLCGAIPVVPDRASYSEIYLDVFKYPSEWTDSFDSYVKNRDRIIEFIMKFIDNYTTVYNNELQDQIQKIKNEHLIPKQLLRNLI